MHVRVLGSSSSGNCTVLWDNGRAVLIDIGFSLRYISRHLRPIGLSFREVAGVVITHAHGDHVHPNTLSSILALGIPVFAPHPILDVLCEYFREARKARGTPRLRPIQSGHADVGPFSVDAWAVPHDAAGGCYAYTVSGECLTGVAKATVATDLGYVPEGLTAHCADSHVLVVESNHDPVMLESSRRPLWLKERIRTIGHLSNEKAGHFVRDVLTASRFLPDAVVLAHVSKECNTNARAVESMQRSLHEHGAGSVRVVETFRNAPNETVSFCL
ncbi:MAG: Zn-dependent hydrolase (beta-lactamase superfamily) [Bacteroidetes bacterium]|nr:Zn-dependent hydrolase (beta-lactamase superfamily) [Bacteroidota bacterium]